MAYLATAGAATFGNHSCVHAVVHTLLANLIKYPADLHSIWRYGALLSLAAGALLSLVANTP
jgi:hypothetical protein